MRSALRRRLGLEALEARRVLDSTVVINELFYHPADNEANEWIELHNQMSVDMDVSSWSLNDGIDTSRYGALDIAPYFASSYARSRYSRLGPTEMTPWRCGPSPG